MTKKIIAIFVIGISEMVFSNFGNVGVYTKHPITVNANAKNKVVTSYIIDNSGVYKSLTNIAADKNYYLTVPNNDYLHNGGMFSSFGYYTAAALECFSSTRLDGVQPSLAGNNKTYTNTNGYTLTATYKQTSATGTPTLYQDPTYMVFGQNVDVTAVKNGTEEILFDKPVYNLDFAIDDIDGNGVSGPESAIIKVYDNNNNQLSTAALQSALVFTGSNLTVTYPVAGELHVISKTNSDLSGNVTDIRLTFPSTLGINRIVYTQSSNGGSNYNDFALLGACIQPFCYKPGATSGTVLDTNHGITALGRAGANNDNWPMTRKGGWMALESKTKGFVLNRITAAQISAIPSANLVEGMTVYDTTNKCLKMYTSTDGGSNYAWYCISTQTCPN